MAKPNSLSSTQELLQFLYESFDLRELKYLAFDIGIEHEDILGQTKSEFIRELISYCERRDRLQELADQAYKLRPSSRPPQTLQASAPRPQYTPNDPYTRYEIGLSNLEAMLGYDHPRYNEFFILRQRLEENIANARLYGDNSERSSNRAEIIGRLNSLALSTTGQPF